MALSAPPKPYDIATLQQILRDLRDPNNGCPWDREQTFATIAPYTIEEAYEVADAIERNDMDGLRDELGDLLLQTIYHAQIASERGAFDLDGIITAICDKMIRRHPHVYGDAATRNSDEQTAAWSKQKADERSKSGMGGTLDGIAMGLPSLTRAAKLQSRAARVGFDWPDASGPRAKIDEELAECDAASTDPVHLEAEIGDLLFSVVNWARHMGVDPDAALRGTNARFTRRFATVEALATAPLSTLPLDELESLWSRAKVIEAMAK